MDKNGLFAKLSKSKKWDARDISGWKWLSDRGYSPAEIFLDEGPASVAVYTIGGDENAAELLIGDLTENGVEIAFLVTSDNDEACLAGKKADFVVVVSNDDFFETKTRLRSLTGAEILSLRGAVNLVYAKYVMYPFYSDFYRGNGVRACFLEWPNAGDFDGLDLYDRVRDVKFSLEEYRKNPERFAELYRDIDEYSGEYIREIFAELPVTAERGKLLHADYVSGYLNVANGLRMTYAQPERASAGVYVMGGCMALGVGADDRRTLSSFLQYLINGRYGTFESSDCIVYNLGKYFANDEYYLDFMKNDVKLQKTAIQIFRSDLGYTKGTNGPVHRYIKKFMAGYGLDYIDLTPVLLEAERKERVYIDSTHTNHRGYRAVAQKVFDEFLRPLMDNREDIAIETGEPGRVLSVRAKWDSLRRSGRSLSEFFLDIGSRSVGIYPADADGGDEISEFSRELTAAGIEVEYVTPCGVPVKEPDERNDGKKARVIVDMRNREMEGEKRPDNPAGASGGAVSFGDLAGMVWDRYFFYPEITRFFKRSGAYLCLVWWPAADELGLPPSGKPYERTEYPGEDVIGKNYGDYAAYLYNDIPAFSRGYLREVLAGNDYEPGNKTPLRAPSTVKFVSVENGLRRTPGCPGKYEHTVYLFGGGAAFGAGAEDRFTISSFMQEHINNHAHQFGVGSFRVENRGVRRQGVGEREIFAETITPLFDRGTIRGGDAVIWIMDKRYSAEERDGAFSYLSGFLGADGIHTVDLTHTLRLAQKNKRVYVDRRHVNHRGYKAAASKIYFDYLKDVMDGKISLPGRGRRGAAPFAGDPALDGGQNEEFKEYLAYLEGERAGDTRSAGAIVMNCNPFTLGHRYLAERAASMTDILYVFVVEEEKSFFSFEDRYRLVLEGLRDLKNVKVLRSGKFIISAITFPGYFSKGSASEATVD
ncbi:MAG: adenylyltransferase/cytidyltransferase family protein, partial [Synergistaceae bacterium]|nr:adenylyltransferase/cytidyltransferase family protein [Synergistaceae bacterium]